MRYPAAVFSVGASTLPSPGPAPAAASHRVAAAAFALDALPIGPTYPGVIYRAIDAAARRAAFYFLFVNV